VMMFSRSMSSRGKKTKLWDHTPDHSVMMNGNLIDQLGSFTYYTAGDHYPGGKSGLTDIVCYKRLLHMVGFLRPPATTSGWTTFPTGYCNSEIQDGVQDGRHVLKSPYYHRLLLYFNMQYIVSMVFEVRESIYDGFRLI